MKIENITMPVRRIDTVHDIHTIDDIDNIDYIYNIDDIDTIDGIGTIDDIDTMFLASSDTDSLRKTYDSWSYQQQNIFLNNFYGSSPFKLCFQLEARPLWVVPLICEN